jgi:hypothetical protein
MQDKSVPLRALQSERIADGPNAASYSVLNAFVGEIDAARLAGTMAATNAQERSSQFVI